MTSFNLFSTLILQLLICIGYAGASFSRMDSLFIIASTGEPRFRAQVDSCQRQLVSNDSVTVTYLLQHRLRDQTPRQRHYVETLFALLADSGKNTRPGQKLAEGMHSQPDSLKPQLLYIASTMGDKRLAALGQDYLHDSDLEVRCMAIRILGAYPDSLQIPYLMASLASNQERERHLAVWALSAHAPFMGCEKMGYLFTDSALSVRAAAESLLCACAKGDWKHLVIPTFANTDQALRSSWLRLASRVGGSAATSFLKKELPKLPIEFRRYLPPDSVLYSPRRIIP